MQTIKNISIPGQPTYLQSRKVPGEKCPSMDFVLASFRMNTLIEYGNSPNETLVNVITKLTNITFITMLLILSLVELSFDWLLNTNDCN